MSSIQIQKAAVNGALLGCLAKYRNPNARVNVLGTRMPLWAVAAGGSAAASIFGDIAHSYILPHIPPLEKYSRQESAILNPILNGAAYVGAWYMINDIGMLQLGPNKLFWEAAFGEIAGHYISTSFL